MARNNSRTKYWLIGGGKVCVERQRYMYKQRNRRRNHPLWQLLHEIELGWKDGEKLVKRKQHKI